MSALATTMAVVIVNYNTCQHLRACLATIECEAATEVVVVDNASTDGSVTMVQDEYPWVQLELNKANPGYGSAANQAIDRCQAQYVLLLNSDTHLQPGALQALKAYLDEHPKVAIAGPRLVNPDGSLQPSCYPNPTPLFIFLEESALGRLVGLMPILRDRYLRTWPHTNSRAVPWVLGAALAIRREAFNSVGGFDPSFFLYAEEIDLCFRLRQTGWQIHFTSGATIMHVGGASTMQQRVEMSVQFFMSLMHFYRRHYSEASQRQLLLIMKCIVYARLLRDTIRIHLIHDKGQRTRIAENLGAWKQIISWKDPALYP
jgi:GT2 family glycosyltransferase